MNAPNSSTRVWRRASEILPLARHYEKYLVDLKTSILRQAWDEIRETYTKGIFVRLFNPKLVEWFENNRSLEITDRRKASYVYDILLPEHAWKLSYAWSCHDGELEYVRKVIVQCSECLSPENGVIIVTLDDIQNFMMVDAHVSRV